jgi:hypothetical protein
MHPVIIYYNHYTKMYLKELGVGACKLDWVGACELDWVGACKLNWVGACKLD